jgi:hypothetical protein
VGISPGAGAGPTPGMSPAKAVPERTHASVIAIRNRFMDCSPLSLGPCKTFYIELSRTTTHETLQAGLAAN